jgi:hypothetical protein
MELRRNYNGKKFKDDESYYWIGRVIQRSKSRAYYAKIVSPKDDFGNRSEYSLGDTILLYAGEGARPYIAEIEALYENIRTNEKYVQPRWFFRPSDVRENFPELLEDLDYHEEYDIFFSSESPIDINLLIRFFDHAK